MKAPTSPPDAPASQADALATPSPSASGTTDAGAGTSGGEVTLDMVLATQPCKNWPRSRVAAVLAEIDRSSWASAAAGALDRGVSRGDVILTACRHAAKHHRKILVGWMLDRSEWRLAKAGRFEADLRAIFADLRRWTAGESVQPADVRDRARTVRAAAASAYAASCAAYDAASCAAYDAASCAASCAAASAAYAAYDAADAAAASCAAADADAAADAAAAAAAAAASRAAVIDICRRIDAQEGRHHV